MTTQRRGFLKLGSAILGSLTLIKYAEPVLAMADTFNDWVEDKGDFFIVRVPDFKTFSKETLDKPTIFLLGQQAIVKDVDVGGFVNIYAPKGGRLADSRINASRMTVEQNRPVINLNATNMAIDGCYVVPSKASTSAFEFHNYKYEAAMTSNRNFFDSNRRLELI